MDDLTFLDTDPDRLATFIEPVDMWLHTHRKQELNRAKTSLKPLGQGIEYLGYKIKQTPCQSDPAQLFVTRIKKWEFINDLRDLEKTGLMPPQNLHPFEISPSKKRAQLRLASINSRLGMHKHAASCRLRRATIEKFIRTLYPIVEMPDDFVASKWIPIKTKRKFEALKIK